MKIARFRTPDGDVFAGDFQFNTVRALLPGDGNAGQWAVVDLAQSTVSRLPSLGEWPIEEVRLLAPIPFPGAIRDFYAFEEHVATANRTRGREIPQAWYDIPVFYFSNPHTVRNPSDEISAPPGCVELDYELEVACVVGRDLVDVTPEQALDAIVGYTIFNDWSARDFQRHEMSVGLGPAKGKDFASTFGPWMVTPDELPGAESGRPEALMRATVNDQERSRGRLESIRWSFAELVSYASRGSMVRRGDLIGSGTVGTGCLLELNLTQPDDPQWLNDGDTVALTVDGIGTLQTRIGTRK